MLLFAMISFVSVLKAEDVISKIQFGTFALFPENQQKCPDRLRVSKQVANENKIDVQVGYKSSGTNNSVSFYYEYRGAVDVSSSSNSSVKCVKISATYDGNFLDHAVTKCNKQVATEALIASYSCWKGNLIFGAGGKCNPEQFVKRGKKKSAYLLVDFSKPGMIQYNHSREDGVSKLPNCQYSSTALAN